MIPWSCKLSILWVLCLIFAVYPLSDVVLGEARELSLQRPGGRSLLSYPATLDVELVGAPNGTVYLTHSDSRKILWSFPSGPPIYLSHRAPVQQDKDKDHAHALRNNSFLDCGDDWQLYMHTNNGKSKLEGTIQDYVKKTPLYQDDEVTVGSMHSTVFRVDLGTGRLIYNYGKSISANMPKGGQDALPAGGGKEVESSVSSSAQLYIERIDYSLSTKAFGKLLWNLTIGFFKAKVRCIKTGNLFDAASLDLDYKLGSGSDTHRIVSLPCEFEIPVLRFREQSMFDYFLRLDGMTDPETEDNMLPADAPRHLPSSLHKDDELSATQEKGSWLPVHSHRHPVREALEIGAISHSTKLNKLRLVRRFAPWSLVVLVVLLVGYVLHHKASATQQKYELNLGSNLSSQSVSSRRRRSRKSARSISGLEGENTEKAIKRWPDLNSLVQSDTDGRRIGRLFVSSREIAKGSNGTVVYEGIYEGRKVAVKRMVQAHHDVAFKEIQNLIASDQHPNVVRWYGVEYDPDFVYVALEHCSCNLNDLVESLVDSSQNLVTFNSINFGAITEHKARLSSVKAIMQDINLWKSNGHPSALLLKLMRDVVSGLVHLHDLGIIHRDLKPQNVLINKEKTLCAKLSDMGISKRLPADRSSLGHNATGNGSSGWQAPEQLLYERQTRAVDMFSLGCVLFFCVTRGKHPFGERYDRDSNIIKNQVDLFLVDNFPEALELFTRLLQPDPLLRPKASEVLHHPFFWNSEMRLSFLHDASDRVELEDRESNSTILQALESVGPVAIGARWSDKMEPDFINNIGSYRRYNYESVRDLLRVMRNKLNHYRELPADIQALLGPVPDGFDDYFTSRFPGLLIEVYKVVYKHCKTEKWFQKYLQGGVI